MHWTPTVALVLIVVIALARSPLFALIVAVPLFVLFLLYAGMRPRAGQQLEPPADSADERQDEAPS